MRTKDCEERVRHCMELCLLLAIDTKMKEQNGEDWFNQLYASEATVRQKDLEKGKKSTAVLEEKHTELGLCDLQALLKLLVYRKPYRNTTFRHILDTDSTKITSTLDSLIQFRNKALAHKEIAVKEKDPGEYGYDHALLDMLYLLRCFPEIRGQAHPEENLTKEICYYEYALDIYQQYKAEGGMFDYAVEDLIRENGLDITVDAFTNICDELKVPVFRTTDQVWYISSRDPQVDVARVVERFHYKDMEKQADAAQKEAAAAKKQADAAKKEAAQAKASPEKKRWAIVAAVIAGLLLLAGLGSTFSDRSGNSEDKDFEIPNLGGSSNSSVDDRIQEEIDTFVETAGNTINLKVGEGHRPSSAVWLNGGGGSCYSTNESVITISSTGNVKAVAEGEAFVVIKTQTNMFEVYKYIVKGKYKTEEELIQEEIDTFVEGYGNTTELKVGQTHEANGSVWLQGGGGTCYSTDESVVIISSVGNVKAVGEGEAFVVVKASTGMYQVSKYIVTGQAEEEDTRIQVAIESFAETALNTSRLKIGQKHTPSAAVWLQGSSGSCYSTDESVVVVSSTGTATAVGVGEAFVVIETGMGMYSIHKYIVE